jgi:transcription-repair coupling factor (superfamily II helicase)
MQQLCRFTSVQVSALPLTTAEAACRLRVESVERFSGNVAKLHEELQTVAAGNRVLIACHNEAELHRLN